MTEQLDLSRIKPGKIFLPHQEGALIKIKGIENRAHSGGKQVIRGYFKHVGQPFNEYDNYWELNGDWGGSTGGTALCFRLPLQEVDENGEPIKEEEYKFTPETQTSITIMKPLRYKSK